MTADTQFARPFDLALHQAFGRLTNHDWEELFPKCDPSDPDLVCKYCRVAIHDRARAEWATRVCGARIYHYRTDPARRTDLVQAIKDRALGKRFVQELYDRIMQAGGAKDGFEETAVFNILLLPQDEWAAAALAVLKEAAGISTHKEKAALAREQATRLEDRGALQQLAYEVFHRLWSQDRPAGHYVKDDWVALQIACNKLGFKF